MKYLSSLQLSHCFRHKKLFVSYSNVYTAASIILIPATTVYHILNLNNPLNIINSPTNALVNGNAILANAIITSIIVSTGALCATPPKLRNFSYTQLFFNQFNHNPQSNNINTMIEHLYHHSFQSQFV